MPIKPTPTKTITYHVHGDDKRKIIPSAEHQPIIEKTQQKSVRVEYERRNRDLDPQLVWRGKDDQDWSDLVVYAPPLYIQEKIQPKVLIDDLLRQTRLDWSQDIDHQSDLFGDFNGIPEGVDKTEFYQHDQNWSNRMILGDSLQVMAGLAEREGLRGKVQCIYLDPPYGIKFNSNFQWSTTSRDVKDGNPAHITREPEQVKAFRDTWRDGIHSYLTYLRDRLTVARDLLTDSGSIFVQIGDENVHRVRAVMDEVFGDDNFVSTIMFQTSGSSSSSTLEQVINYVLWYCRDIDRLKYRKLLSGRSNSKNYDKDFVFVETLDGALQRRMTQAELNAPASLKGKLRRFRSVPCNSQHYSITRTIETIWRNKSYIPGADRQWSVEPANLSRVSAANRLFGIGNSLMYKVYADEAEYSPVKSVWLDTSLTGFGADKIYIVQTSPKVIERCILMATDPGDLVLDPTCGSGTTAFVAEQWGRRWITIDTSRVALALARARIMGARYPFYLLADSQAGQLKEAEITKTAPSNQPTRGNVRQGFVYERVPHITLKSIANNAEIDVIWEKWQEVLEPLREKLNAAFGTNWQEWEVPREHGASTERARSEHGASTERARSEHGASTERARSEHGASTERARSEHGASTERARSEHGANYLAQWWAARIARQKEIDASIASKAEFEYLYDKPYEDKKKVRVAGPFTVESLSPHRMLGVDENDALIDPLETATAADETRTFAQMILENLKTAGVQQAHKDDKIEFTALTPWPGDLVCAEGRYVEGDTEKRAAVFIGPEFGTVMRADLVEAAREAADAGFDALIACGFNYEAHAADFSKLGRVPVLKARMNADLHMADTLKNTGKGNLFVIFGEPDVEILPTDDGRLSVKIHGVDVFDPSSGKVRSDGADGIACWFIDTDYNEESFFVRHAYFLGAKSPYEALKTTLKAEINAEAWESLHSDTSRPFDKPTSGRIAVKVINHLGDEVMKVFKVR